MSEFPKNDVRYLGYAPASCPNCGRLRLEMYVDGPEDDERMVGFQCEKCRAQWLLDPEKLDYYHEYNNEANPLRPNRVENDPFGGVGE